MYPYKTLGVSTKGYSPISVVSFSMTLNHSKGAFLSFADQAA
jgi:hypothetical protein